MIRNAERFHNIHLSYIAVQTVTVDVAK